MISSPLYARSLVVFGTIFLFAFCLPVSAASVRYQDMLISPDGEYLSAVSHSDGSDTLVILNRDTFKPNHVEAFPEDARIIRHVWATDSRLIVEFERSGGHGAIPPTYTELFALDADGGRKLLLYGINAGERQTGSHIKKREFARANPEILSILPDDKNNILIAYQPWGRTGVWEEREKIVTEINILTGRTSNFSLEAPTLGASTLTTSEGKPRFAFGTDETGSANGYVRAGAEWQPFDLGNNRKVTPVAVSDDTLFALKDTDGERGMDALVSYSLATGDEIQLYSSKDAQISTVLKPLDNGVPFGLVLEGNPKSYVFLKGGSPEKTIYKDLLGQLSGYEFRLLSADETQSHWTLSLDLGQGKRRFYLYDSNSAELKLILADQ
ncbi:hypothetical protein [Microbulbifer yueqingensis]|uniref:S9 family peptidase n=1 Tax=Microbulbifer yueqingensis TaxID=658219 RepID=A0A1G8VRX4_9GAMM|nr:hypothetical protein [Microbulbifer yueqingensis]SDJ68145.1 hypothetical protein SAMN05216212_0678 [Microbulbifer yueqingensis]